MHKLRIYSPSRNYLLKANHKNSKTSGDLCSKSTIKTPDRREQQCFTLETGMSDFHKLIINILKVKPDKLPPRIINYRDNKNAFNNKLQISLKNFDMNNSSFIELKTIFMELLNKFAPQKLSI